AYCRSHPTEDLGLHLTLNSEWTYLKWGPVIDKSQVPSLINQNGFLFSTVDSLHRSGKLADVEKELRAQIERAKQFGIDFTHFDSHMGALFGNMEYLKTLIKLGREYKVPVMLSKGGFGATIDNFINDKDILLDMVYTASPADYKKGMEQYYPDVFKSI